MKSLGPAETEIDGCVRLHGVFLESHETERGEREREMERERERERESRRESQRERERVRERK
jgi:Zn-finger nucleic acid-binding protein